MIEIIVGDITSLSVDAIVNAANESLMGGGGVDGAIHSAAGPDLLAFNRQLRGCPTGEARLSPGFNLKAQWIIHTVGPVWQGGDAHEAEVLASCYRACFEIARGKSLSSIAFPAISTGVYGYPKDKAAEIALGAMRENEQEFNQIVACCFNQEDARIYQDILSASS